MRYVIYGSDGRSLGVDAVDWMMAMAGAIQSWRLDVSGWAARPAQGGGMEVVDARSGASWVVAPEGIDAIAAFPRAGPIGQEALPERDDPSLRPADHRTFHDESEGTLGPPADLPSMVAARATEIGQAATPLHAWGAAVDLIRTLVPCEAGSALQAEASSLRFVIARGPGSADLVGREVPFGAGIAGAALDAGATVRVDDVSVDQRHFNAFDDETGFDTRSILAVPVRRGERFFGVIELLNPPGGFRSWHVEVAEIVAKALGAHLDR